MLLFILLKSVETAANPLPAHWVGQTHGICSKCNPWVAISSPGSAVVGVCLVVGGCCSQPLTPLCAEIPSVFIPISLSFQGSKGRQSNPSSSVITGWHCHHPGAALHLRFVPSHLLHPLRGSRQSSVAHCLLFAGTWLGFSPTEVLVWRDSSDLCL